MLRVTGLEKSGIITFINFKSLYRNYSSNAERLFWSADSAAQKWSETNRTDMFDIIEQVDLAPTDHKGLSLHYSRAYCPSRAALRARCRPSPEPSLFEDVNGEETNLLKVSLRRIVDSPLASASVEDLQPASRGESFPSIDTIRPKWQKPVNNSL